MSAERKVKVVQDVDQEIPVEILAKSIVKISDSMDKIKSAGLTERALVMMIAELSGESKTTVKNVIWAMSSLKREFVK